MDFNQGHDKLASDLTLIGRSFGHVENVFYLATGVLLSITAALALFSASLALWNSVEAWGAPKEVIVTIDRVMFTLMLLELLHTVRVSIREHTLTPDPFLVVGLSPPCAACLS